MWDHFVTNLTCNMTSHITWDFDLNCDTLILIFLKRESFTQLISDRSYILQLWAVNLTHQWQAVVYTLIYIYIYITLIFQKMTHLISNGSMGPGASSLPVDIHLILSQLEKGMLMTRFYSRKKPERRRFQVFEHNFYALIFSVLDPLAFYTTSVYFDWFFL